MIFEVTLRNKINQEFTDFVVYSKIMILYIVGDDGVFALVYYPRLILVYT